MSIFGANDAWRKHPSISGNFRAAFPGLGLGLTLFAAYVAVEHFYEQGQSKTGGDSHSH